VTHETFAGREALTATALTYAREAAALVHLGWRSRPRVEHKGRVDLVTEFDRASERVLRERLHRETPYPVVGEELGGDDAAQGAPVTWFVDPIDGTTNFVHGHPFYCVSVGLIVEGAPVVGAVVAPALATEWSGFVGGFAVRNGARCQVSKVDRLPDALLATGFPYDRATSEDNNFDAFCAIKRKAQAVRRCGSAAMDLCLVADGTYDGYWEKKLGPWDCMAGAAIVLAAGGRISDYAGGAADILSGQLLATNGSAIHGALVSELQKLPSSWAPPAPRSRR
jgi:myo-inositol-1(or 4)-monophosphatase